MITVTCVVKANQLKLYHELIKKNNGRYLSNPFYCFNSYQLSFTFDKSEDDNNFHKELSNYPQNIIEETYQNNSFFNKLFRTIATKFNICKP